MKKRLVVVIIAILAIIICFNNTASSEPVSFIWGKVKFGSIPIKGAEVEADASKTFYGTTNSQGIYSIQVGIKRNEGETFTVTAKTNKYHKTKTVEDVLEGNIIRVDFNFGPRGMFRELPMLQMLFSRFPLILELFHL